MAIVVLGIVCVQVTAVCVWQLLTMVRRDTVFSAAAFRYVDVIIDAAVASLLAIALSSSSPRGRPWRPASSCSS